MGNSIYNYDNNGHGTHIAGIIAGSGAASNGRYKGMAPNANIVAIKVLDQNGNGKIANVINGLRWLLTVRNTYNIRVLNISFGTTPDEDIDDSSILIKMVEHLWDTGIIVVAAAGNNGPHRTSVTVPGISKKIITVGAYDDSEFDTTNINLPKNYSGRGPTPKCIMKPEILAPGTDIISCGTKKDAYSVKSGTSMAAPIVTGAIILLLQKYPNLTPKQVKQHLKDTAIHVPTLPDNQQGWGLINIKDFLDL